MKILIIKLSAIGDVVQSLCVLDALRYRYPQAEIDWLVSESAAGLLYGHPLLERVILYPRKRLGEISASPVLWPNLLSEGREFLNELRKKSYDTIIDLQGLLKSGLLTWLAKGRRKIGFASGREGSSLFLNEKLEPYDPEEHAVLRYMRIAHHLGADPSLKPRFPVGTVHEDMKKARHILKENHLEPQKIIGLIPGTRWHTKHWNPHGFARTAELIRNSTRYEPVIFGGMGDRGLAQDIQRLASVRIADLTGTSDLRTLAAIFKMTAAVITTDTGPMHLAAAAGTRVVALFGPTAPNRTGPFCSRACVIRKDMDCSPCLRRSCDDIRCMKDIHPSEVMEGLHSLLHST